MMNCGTAKLMPATRIAGQISIVRLNPQNVTTSQNGTITEKNGNWRPTIADSVRRYSSVFCVTLFSTMIGVPRPP